MNKKSNYRFQTNLTYESKIAKYVPDETLVFLLRFWGKGRAGLLTPSYSEELNFVG